MQTKQSAMKKFKQNLKQKTNQNLQKENASSTEKKAFQKRQKVKCLCGPYTLS